MKRFYYNDTKASNLIKFYKEEGYKIAEEEELYNENVL